MPNYLVTINIKRIAFSYAYDPHKLFLKTVFLISAKNFKKAGGRTDDYAPLHKNAYQGMSKELSNGSGLELLEIFFFAFCLMGRQWISFSTNHAYHAYLCFYIHLPSTLFYLLNTACYHEQQKLDSYIKITRQKDLLLSLRLN